MEKYRKLENVADGPLGSLPNIGSHLRYNRHFMDAAGKVKRGAGGRNGGGPKKKPVSRSVRANLQFSVGRIGRYSQWVGIGAPVYMNVILAAKVLKLAGKCDERFRGMCCLCLVVRNNEEIRKLLQGVTIAHGGELPNISPVLLPKKNGGDHPHLLMVLSSPLPMKIRLVSKITTLFN